MKRNVSVVRLIVATRSSGPPASGKIIKEMPSSVASGTPYIINSSLWMLFVKMGLYLLRNYNIHNQQRNSTLS